LFTLKRYSPLFVSQKKPIERHYESRCSNWDAKFGKWGTEIAEKEARLVAMVIWMHSYPSNLKKKRLGNSALVKRLLNAEKRDKGFHAKQFDGGI